MNKVTFAPIFPSSSSHSFLHIYKKISPRDCYLRKVLYICTVKLGEGKLHLNIEQVLCIRFSLPLRPIIAIEV